MVDISKKLGLDDMDNPLSSDDSNQDMSERGRKGGQASSSKQDMSKIGRKGGQAAQDSGNAHELTQEERSRGGSESGGNFANDPQRASEAGKKGGSR